MLEEAVQARGIRLMVGELLVNVPTGEIGQQGEPLAKLLGLAAWRSPQFSW